MLTNMRPSAYKTPGAPFVPPAQLAAADGTITLSLSVYTYRGPTVSHLTRSFSAEQRGRVVSELLGPTIRVRPGERLRVRLTNNLGPELCDMSAVHNSLKNANVTSLHTHGLHISPRAPGDDALTEVPPGDSREYIYDIPNDHMGGTFWYHPHAHGADAEQAGGGAFGMLIVEDSPLSELPPAIASLEEITLALVGLNMPALAGFAEDYVENCLEQPGCTAATCANPIWGQGPLEGEEADVLLVNGQTRPTITMAARRWYRWRLLYAAGGGEVIYPTLNGSCEVRRAACVAAVRMRRRHATLRTAHRAPRAMHRAPRTSRP